ncbi:hypothetical protein SYNTR_1883 [Candidatus Syntrophocurvum alkaliphilum]|uniref:Uncharacterized protein n=1 Tax=Candidatus Syntrophocurvum alkaliphilum TaxID=2293317 RepID=A0A6I6DKD0_9FIRM|nr:hypothetical protein SYNTR_1883 [Candidatus Syntrophocurvum alkaliphilum]
MIVIKKGRSHEQASLFMVACSENSLLNIHVLANFVICLMGI